MNDHKILRALAWCLRTGSTLLFALWTLTITGCNNPLEVDENPNSVLEEDLDDPAAAPSIVSGSLGTAAKGISYALAPYTTATDEGRWRGSRDAWNQLDRGNLSDFNNEFVDASWPFITEARYSTDKAIERVAKFKANAVGTPDANKFDKLLIRAYVYSALMRVTIADMFDDFVISDKKEPGQAIGSTNMSRLYDEAIANLDKALVINQLSHNKDAELNRFIYGMLARAKHAKAVWLLLNPPGQTLTNRYVNAGTDDATAALAIMAKDYRWQLTYSSSLLFYNEWSYEVNSRGELDVISAIKDPFDNVDDPRILAETADFKDKTKYGGDRYSPFTVISEREMQLILAEAAVAAGNNQGALDILNPLRARNTLKPVTDVAQAGALLQHERRANLFMMGRRLADMYRFGITVASWVPTSDAITRPGTFFPITISERRANPNLTGGR